MHLLLVCLHLHQVHILTQNIFFLLYSNSKCIFNSLCLILPRISVFFVLCLCALSMLLPFSCFTPLHINIMPSIYCLCTLYLFFVHTLNFLFQSLQIILPIRPHFLPVPLANFHVLLVFRLSSPSSCLVIFPFPTFTTQYCDSFF